MIYGTKDNVAIECYHEPFGDNIHNNIFGRMCFWFNGLPFGDLSEPACILDVTTGHLNDFLNKYKELEDNELINYSDLDLFNFLDSKLYVGDYSDGEQVEKDAIRYFKFDFLTNGGESFDNYKSFIFRDGNTFRVLFTDTNDNFFSAQVLVDDLLLVVNKFIKWVDCERKILTIQ